ncbi:MAG: hypothetical protein R2879_11555 [Saprospiraceae bacterium]
MKKIYSGLLVLLFGISIAMGQTNLQIHAGTNFTNLTFLPNAENPNYSLQDRNGLFSFYGGLAVEQSLNKRLSIQYDFSFSYFYDKETHYCGSDWCCMPRAGIKSNYFTNSLVLMYQVLPNFKAGAGAFMGALENLRTEYSLKELDFFDFEKPHFGAQIKAQYSYKNYGLELIYFRALEGSNPTFVYPKESIRLGVFYVLVP